MDQKKLQEKVQVLISEVYKEARSQAIKRGIALAKERKAKQATS
jgi:hypothetical protein